MSKKKIGLVSLLSIAATGILSHALRKRAEQTSYTAELMEPIEQRKKGFYEKYVKRGFDVACATGAIACFSPIYIGVAALVKFKLGSPVLFTQDRPGLIGPDGKERIFKMYKFRTMTDERDANGELLPDDVRLTKFGSLLRSTSLDELPEAINILNGTMSVIGPRPQLVRDMTFMSKEQRKRHTAKPGLSGLAQINGRNDIDWNDKINWDLKYIESINPFEDARIVFQTIEKAFVKQEGITEGDMATAEDYGDYLLKSGAVDQCNYDYNQKTAKQILSHDDGIVREKSLVSVVMPSYNTAEYITDSIQSVLNQTYPEWELIIVDDCSTDSTMEVLSRFDDKRIKILQNDVNSGAAVSRNKALRAARGQWIAFLDSDDIWLPDKLKRQIAFMEKNNYSFSYTNYQEIDEKGKLTGKHITGPRVITKTGMYNYCWPGCLTVMYDSSVVGQIQINDIKKNNDYALWLSVVKKTNCFLLNEELALYRRGRANSISTQSIATMIKWHYKLFNEAEDQNKVTSAINTLRNIFFGSLKKVLYVRNESDDK